VAPGITIRDRLRVLLPNDTESYYKHRQLIPSDMLDEINKAKIVITNYHLFGQLKRISKQWLNDYLVCKGGTYPAQLSYKVIADMACEKIHAAITRAGMQSEGERIVKALLDPYNPEGSTTHVNFRTSKEDLYQTAVEQCHVNWVVLDSDWEAEFCRVAEAHPNVLAYVKNHNLGLDVPYRFLSESRKYIPDFIVLVDDGHGPDDPLHLIVEIKGYRQEDAKIKKETMDTYWIPGVNNHGTFGRWAFAEFTDVYEMQDDFEQEVTGKFESMLAACTQATTADPLCENAPNKPQNT
jgi:type III restriction enzyme